jgi:hypothetical protein
MGDVMKGQRCVAHLVGWDGASSNRERIFGDI